MSRKPTEPGKVFVTDSTATADDHRRWAVRQAIDKIVGGPLPYDPDVHLYYPNLLHAEAILCKSAMHCLVLDYRPADYAETAQHLRASYAKMGITFKAPFSTVVTARMLEKAGV